MSSACRDLNLSCPVHSLVTVLTTLCWCHHFVSHYFCKLSERCKVLIREMPNAVKWKTLLPYISEVGCCEIFHVLSADDRKISEIRSYLLPPTSFLVYYYYLINLSFMLYNSSQQEQIK